MVHIRILVGLVVAIAAVSAEEETNADCPRFFDRYRNSCYRFVTTALTWAQADQYCTFYKDNNYDTHLVTIDDQSEHQFLRSLIRPDPNLNLRNFWTGLNKVDRFRGWVWGARNNDLEYDDWAPGEPGGEGNCVFLWQGNDWRFVDWDCREVLPFICELELTP